VNALRGTYGGTYENRISFSMLEESARANPDACICLLTHVSVAGPTRPNRLEKTL
jgi:hypothetical protein